jgi:hypothetical protein
MYHQSDIADIQKQLRRRILAWLMPGVVLLCLVVFCFIKRVEWLTAALFALLGCLAVFAMHLYILPLARYRRFLELAVHGRQRHSVLLFKSFDDQAVVREGVRFYPLLFSAGSPGEAMDDRLIYWDANLPPPTWNPGDKLAIFSHEKALTSWTPADENETLSG